MPVDRGEKCRSNTAKLQARSPVFSSPSLSDSLHFGSWTRWTFADTALAVVASLVTFWPKSYKPRRIYAAINDSERRKVKNRSRPGGEPASRDSTSRNISYICFFVLIWRTEERFETLPANSSEASRLLNSATSAANTYLLFAIRWVRSQPRFSYRHADALDKPVIWQKRCNDIGGTYSAGTVFCGLAKEFCEFT